MKITLDSSDFSVFLDSLDFLIFRFQMFLSIFCFFGHTLANQLRRTRRSQFSPIALQNCLWFGEQFLQKSLQVPLNSEFRRSIFRCCVVYLAPQNLLYGCTAVGGSTLLDLLPHLHVRNNACWILSSVMFVMKINLMMPSAWFSKFVFFGQLF